MGTFGHSLKYTESHTTSSRFFFAKEGGLLSQRTMDYYLWAKPQNKPFFQTRSKQKTFSAIVGREKTAPSTGGEGWTKPGLRDQLVRGAVLVCDPDSLCDSDSFSHSL